MGYRDADEVGHARPPFGRGARPIKQSMQGQMPETMQKLTFEPKSKQEAGYTDEAVIQKGQ